MSVAGGTRFRSTCPCRRIAFYGWRSPSGSISTCRRSLAGWSTSAWRSWNVTVYDSSSDQWSAPVGGGLVLHAVVVEPATVIVLRLVVPHPT